MDVRSQEGRRTGCYLPTWKGSGTVEKNKAMRGAGRLPQFITYTYISVLSECFTMKIFWILLWGVLTVLNKTKQIYQHKKGL